MAQRVLQDFIGFTFDGVSSEELGITRVSDGDRFNEELHPEIKDITAEVPGKDGEYYFGSTYGNKEIEIKIAYDSLTESQFRRLRRLFGGKEIHELIFDERPYKKYLVKLSQPIELNYICFDEEKKEEVNFDGIYGPTTVLRGTGEMERRYKGEGTISFISYFPFAKSTFIVLPTPAVAPNNIDEWKDSCGILDSTMRATYKINEYYQNKFNVYNGGDLDAGFRLYCPFAYESTSLAYNGLGLTYKLTQTGTTEIIAQLQFKSESIAKQGNDEGILIDTNNGLILGVTGFDGTNIDISGNAFYTTTGNLYNQYIDSGYFFKLKPSITPDDGYIEVTNGNEHIQIFYDYLYF